MKLDDSLTPDILGHFLENTPCPHEPEDDYVVSDCYTCMIEMINKAKAKQWRDFAAMVQNIRNNKHPQGHFTNESFYKMLNDLSNYSFKEAQRIECTVY